MKKKTIRKLEFYLHLLTGLALLLKGYDEISKGLYYPGFIICIPAVVVLIIMFLWRPLKIAPKHARVAAYYIEAPALLVSSYVFHLEGKELEPYFFLIAAMLYPVVGFVASKKMKKLKKPYRSRA